MTKEAMIDFFSPKHYFLARIQNVEGNGKRPEQETEVISQESSARSSTPRKNGSVVNFESPKASQIQTISQSVPPPEILKAVGPSPAKDNPGVPTPVAPIPVTPTPPIPEMAKPRTEPSINR